MAILHVSILYLRRVHGSLTVCPPVRRFWDRRHAGDVQDLLCGRGGQHGTVPADPHPQYAGLRRRSMSDWRMQGA
eukprot:3547239-Prymnesium_polylepis.1